MNITVSLFAILPGFVVLLFGAWHARYKQKKSQKHDRALFPFCQLRRDIMRFLREHMPDEPNALSENEYHSALRLEVVVSGTISHYNQHKTVMFNIRKVAKYLKQYQHTIKRTDPMDLTENAEIQEFHARFGRLLAAAFIAYTPLIRSELALRLIAQASCIDFRAGKNARIRRLAAEYVTNNAEQARNEARRHGLMGGAPA